MERPKKNMTELERELEIAEWELWISKTLVEVQVAHINLLREPALTEDAVQFAHDVASHAKTFRQLVADLHDELEYHDLLEGYSRVIDAAQEIIRCAS